MRIFLVDDEALICRYIIRCIQEAKGNYEIVGSATSAARALTQIEDLQPDVLFTDIIMPKMDGIELLRTVKERWPGISVVMLTCHDDFEFVRRAMEERADDYVLKSEITPEFIGYKLEKVASKRQKYAADHIVGSMKQTNFLRSLSGAGDRNVYLVTEHDLRESHILLKDDAFVAIAIDYSEKNITMMMQSLPAEFENFLLYHYNDAMCVLLSNIKASTGLQNLEQKERYINLYLNTLADKIDGRIDRSRIYYRLAQLSMAIDEAVTNVEDQFYGGPAAGEMSREEVMRTLHWQIVGFSARLEERDMHRSCTAVQDTLLFAETHHPESKALKELLTQMLDMLRHQSRLTVTWNEDELCAQSSFSALQKCVSGRLEQLQREGRRYSASIRKAIDYIVGNYGEDITLNSVADHVFLNRDYLSRQFKKEVGVTFSEYLLELRMKEALRLLRGSDLRIGEIAERVGVSNVSHFTSVFKKQYQITPSEARRQK